VIFLKNFGPTLSLTAVKASQPMFLIFFSGGTAIANTHDSRKKYKKHYNTGGKIC